MRIHSLLALALPLLPAQAAAQITDVGFDDVTAPPDVDLIVVREQAYGAGSLDLSAYGLGTGHDFVQSIYVRARHGMAGVRHEVQGRLVFPPGITIVGVITDGNQLGGSTDDGLLTASDGVFGIPGFADDYSAVFRGSENAAEAEHMCVRPNNSVDFNLLMRRDDVDDFRVIIDYGTSFPAGLSFDVELTVDDGLAGIIEHELGVRIGTASAMAPGSGDAGEVPGLDGVPLTSSAPPTPNAGHALDPLSGILVNRVGGPLSANHLEVYDPVDRAAMTHARKGVRSDLSRGPHGYVYGNTINFAGFSIVDLETGNSGTVAVPNIEGAITVVGGYEGGSTIVIAGHVAGVNSDTKVNLVDVAAATSVSIVTLPVGTMINPVGATWDGTTAYVLDSTGELAAVDFAAGTFTTHTIPQMNSSYWGLERNAAGTELYALRQASGTAVMSIDAITVPAITFQTGAIVTPGFVLPRAITRDGNGHLWVSRRTFGLPVTGPMVEIDPSTWTVVEVHECAIKWDPNAILAGVNPAPIGARYCSHINPGTGAQPAVPNTTGRPGSILALGSTSVATNEFHLRAIDLPNNSLTMFLDAPMSGFTSSLPNSQGNICLGLASGVGRYQMVAGNAVGGSYGIQVDLTAIVRPNGLAMVMPGETWYFQAWHRQNPSTSNFTDAIAVTFTP